MSDAREEPVRLFGLARGIASEATKATQGLAYVDARIDVAGGAAIAAARRLRFELEMADGQRVYCDATHASAEPTPRSEGR